MSFYIFKLENIRVNHRRGKIPDDDVVVFTILVNQLDRGHGTAIFHGMAASNEGIPCSAVPPNNRLNIDNSWQIGPLEIDAGDIINVVYTGNNISDTHLISLSTQQQDEIELKILNAIAAAGIAGIAGLGSVAEAIAAALGGITDPVAKLIGFKPQGPCNGPVFSGVLPFSGSGLHNLPMVAFPVNKNARPPLPALSRISFTHTYTDEATHNTHICDDIAETDITCSIFSMSFVSLTWSLSDRFPHFRTGLRKFGKPGTIISVKIPAWIAS